MPALTQEAAATVAHQITRAWQLTGGTGVRY